MAQPTFDVGQYVWAKLTGFPHWPAKILELGKVPDGEHYVEFLGQKKTVADAKVKEITVEEYEKFFKLGKKAKGQAFMKSVAELRNVLPRELSAKIWPQRASTGDEGDTARSMPKAMSARKSTSGRSVEASPVATHPVENAARASPVVGSPVAAHTDGGSPPLVAKRPTVKRVATVTASAVERVASAPKGAHVKFAASKDVPVISPSPQKRPVDLLDGAAPPPKVSKTVAADSTSRAASSNGSSRCNYGFIGLGIMGTEMAGNLLKHSHNVVLWNRSGFRHSDLLACGGQVASTPAEVVDRSDIVFTCVSNPSAARDVVTRKGGVLDAMTQGKSYVDMSTVDAATSQFISEAIHKKGGLFLEAPVSGSKKPAQDGQLVILTAGDQELFELARPAFNAMGKSYYFLGAVGNAAKMKLVVNMIMGSMTSALCEGMALASEAGLQQKMLHQILREGALNSKMVETKGAAVLRREFPVSFPLKHQQKDMRLALALGDQVHQPLPLAAAANETFKKAMQLGFSDDDMSSVYAAHSSQNLK